MKRYHEKISLTHRILIISFTVFMSMFVMLNQSIQHKIENKVVDTTAPAQEGEDQAPGTQFSFISSAAVTTIFSLGVVVTSIIVLDFIVEKDTYVKLVDALSTNINMYLKTLFSRIISPNAP